MLKNMPKLGAVLIVVVITVWTGVLVPQALAQRARVPQTGQTTSYAPGDDGDIQAGVPWPSPRFTDRSNGTVRDNLTGLIWLKDAQCFGDLPWAQALTAANNLADDPNSTTTDCGLSDHSESDDWRLPNVKELLSLVDFGQTHFPALADGHPFFRVGGIYWSSTTDADSLGGAYAYAVVIAPDDIIRGLPKDFVRGVWPVQGSE